MTFLNAIRGKSLPLTLHVTAGHTPYTKGPEGILLTQPNIPVTMFCCVAHTGSFSQGPYDVMGTAHLERRSTLLALLWACGYHGRHMLSIRWLPEIPIIFDRFPVYESRTKIEAISPRVERSYGSLRLTKSYRNATRQNSTCGCASCGGPIVFAIGFRRPITPVLHQEHAICYH